ncbi:MAG: PASTA domain-containing protein [Clostridia bacterium]|nr:PASTA domain-containing protein [Clostridia bacterium]
MFENLQAGRLSLNKRGSFVMFFFILCGILLAVRLFFLQIVDFDQYQSNTVNQYTKETVIQAKRGTIYDRNMKVLAISTTVERVFISPNTIPDQTVAEYVETLVEKIDDPEDKKEERTHLLSQFENTSLTVAQDITNELSTRLGVDPAMIKEKIAKDHRADETIKKQVELEDTAEIKKMVAAKHYGGMIHFSEESKRYYPYSSLASHIIGFTGTDGYGLSGVEAYYNNLLSGENGKIVSAKDGVGNEMSTKYDSYIDAVDGSDVMLTVDWTCQSILEKYVTEALEDSQARNRVAGIIMDVNTGEILGMATKPDFNLNDPYTLDAVSQALLDAYVETEELPKSKYRSNLLNELWKNKAVTELYEPGSTFKIITSAMVLEENLVSATENFRCTGYIRIPGLAQPIHCHKLAGHGNLTFEGALGFSCNPFFVVMSQRLGKDLFYKYYRAFGYNETTEVDIYGETSNLFFNMDTYSSVDAAVAAFGQNFKITPISHLRAICAVANGGYLVTPHVLKASLDEEGNVVENYATETKRQVVSTENCEVIWEYLYRSVEDQGGNRNAAVPGYKIAAKTGTSTKTEKSKDEKFYVASCVAFAPADDPEVAVIVLVDEPVGNYYGSTVAAPYVAKILSEVLPYLGVEPEYTEEDKASLGVAISEYVGRSLTYASSNLQGLGLNFEVVGGGSNVVAQSPAAGSKVSGGGKVVLYTEEGLNTPSVTVPNVVGLSASAANRALINAGLNIEIASGTLSSVEGATAMKQSIAAGEVVLPGTVVTVDFRHYNGVTD